jgi:putative aldouronate transport system permease protein
MQRNVDENKIGRWHMKSDVSAAISIPHKRIGILGELIRNYKRRKMLYWMVIPGVLTYIIFKYLPMYGLVIAFKQFNPYGGLQAVWNSPWVGLQWFKTLFSQTDFWMLLRNTITISIYSIIFGFPAPIILAILINDIRNEKFKRISQSITYVPHFLSWAIISGMLIEMLSPNRGLVNNILASFGIEPVFFLADTRYFRPILIGAGIWKEIGWDSIIYLAAIAGIDPTLYEAAIVDGANKWKQTMYIKLPSLAPIITISLILASGRIMDTGFESIYTLYNPNVYSVADVFSTYSYRVGIGGGQFSYITALGLFQNISNGLLVIFSNKISRRISENGLW